MTIEVGQKMPEGQFTVMGENGPQALSTAELFGGKKVVLFGLPGAFTPTCSNKHVPGFVQNADALKAKGVDTIACMSVNDAFVMGAWGKNQQVGDKVVMLADGSAEYTGKLGLGLDLSARGLGQRCRRFSMLVDDGVVKSLNIEENPGEAVASGAEAMLQQV